MIKALANYKGVQNVLFLKTSLNLFFYFYKMDQNIDNEEYLGQKIRINMKQNVNHHPLK